MMCIINELTALQVHMAWKESSGKRSVLVYDMRGGTFDVSLLTTGDDVLR